MICVIDNYDSFVYNLVQYAGALRVECQVFRNDEVSVDTIVKLAPDLLLISPGPGNPDSAGISLEAVRSLAGRVPIFGVCLGHQTIGQVFGAEVVHAKKPMHGKCSRVTHDGRGVFTGLPSPLTVTRYHSLVVAPATLPPEIEVSAWSEDGEVMALRHRELHVESVQFHPESLFTEHGLRMVENALVAARGFHKAREGLVSA
ncbi:anthranilate synthase component II [Streptomyces sp. NBC_00576]|jgi:anthranilate synthase/aminodeoxychorismate synthase-like glutamine amidotransferase|uniref:anthranilate synthase component II n=1 Tax=Streptomyces sp. NBC_00576 TaxID=2903665 RepID=UPI002E80F6F5|nr:aminodeoxychorismate/anthranilate synthase component II [Streptomyces sp. NBC_00576]WUB72001.1 aminodeoxychorismate/anthranilate synthase component II [Streptomyces sp. NBC_00576]